MTDGRDGGFVIVGESSSLRHALALADRFAPSTLPILLVGATGTGKELFAQRIHRASRRSGAFVAVNCAALPRDMIESLFFGHRRGAFTGAVQDHCGYLEAAHRGTLFLDELPSLSLEGQAKLLRAVEAKAFERLGDTTLRHADFRIIAAAQEDLLARVKGAAFRQDLRQRLAQVTIHIASLAERVADIAPLARHFAGLAGKVILEDAEQLLLAHRWVGNVRELRAVIDSAACLDGRGTIGVNEITQALGLRSADDFASNRLETASYERLRLIAACASCEWSAQRTAVALGVSRATLFRRLRQAGVSLRWHRVRSQNERESQSHAVS